MSGQYIYPLSNITANGTYGPFRLSGEHIVGIRGVLGGATVNFFHQMPMQDDPDDLEALPQDADMTFTALPAPFPYKCSPGLPLYISVASASGTTDITVGMFKVGE